MSVSRWRRYRLSVVAVQRMWRGHVGRVAAKEQVARLHRRKFAVRTLLHIRCKRLSDRVRRQELMQLYKLRPVGGLAEPITSLVAHATVKENHNLRQELDCASNERAALMLNVAELRSDLNGQLERAWHTGVAEHAEMAQVAQPRRELANYSEKFTNHEQFAEVRLSRLCSHLNVQRECTAQWKARKFHLEEMNFVQEGKHAEEVKKLKAQIDMLRTDLDVEHKLAKASKKVPEEAVLGIVVVSSVAICVLFKCAAGIFDFKR